MEKEKKTETICFHISHDLRKYVEIKAHTMGMTKTDYLNFLIQREKDNMSNSEKELFEEIIEAREALNTLIKNGRKE